MRLERLDIRGYRRLRGSYELAPALTLVTGPNEAGKSTLHDALIHALFGFSPEERRRREGSSEKEARVPWAGGPFGATLRARDREGRAVLVRWDFASDLVELQDADTGKPLLREQPKQRADYELGRRLVGMTREEFTQVCCLHQEALTTVRPTEELRASLQRSVESAPAEEIGVRSADERLRKLLSSIGVSATYRETRDGELQRLTAREGALLQELDAAHTQRAELDTLAARLEDARGERVLLTERKEALAERAAQLQQASLQAAVAREQGALRARVRELLSAGDPPDPSSGDPPDPSSGDATGPSSGDPLDPSAGDPTDTLAGDPMVARFRARRDHLLAQRALPTRQPWNAALLAAALVTAALAALGGTLVSPPLAVLLAGAAALAWAARPRSHEADPDAPLADFDGRSFAELDHARIEEDHRHAALHAERLAERLSAERELHLAEAALHEHEQTHGALSEAPVADPTSLQPHLGETEAQLRETDTRITTLRTMIAEREAHLADPSDLAVELADVRARREHTELTRDAIRIARDALREAAHDTHRRVAPHLNEALRRELPRITRGRYAEGAVDEELAVRLYAPESGALVSIEQLSRGTRDQVALIQRLEIARLLDPTAGRTPLLLDDPFTHFDPPRLSLGAELIAQVAEHRQVILFTEDPEVARQIRATCPSCALIELPDPVHESAPTPPASTVGALAGA